MQLIILSLVFPGSAGPARNGGLFSNNYDFPLYIHYFRVIIKALPESEYKITVTVSPEPYYGPFIRLFARKGAPATSKALRGSRRAFGMINNEILAAGAKPRAQSRARGPFGATACRRIDLSLTARPPAGATRPTPRRSSPRRSAPPRRTRRGERGCMLLLSDVCVINRRVVGAQRAVGPASTYKARIARMHCDVLIVEKCDCAR